MPKLGVLIIGPHVNEETTPGVRWAAVKWLNCVIVISLGKN